MELLNIKNLNIKQVSNAIALHLQVEPTEEFTNKIASMILDTTSEHGEECVEFGLLDMSVHIDTNILQINHMDELKCNLIISK